MPGEPRALTSEVLTEEAKDQVIDDKSRNADKDPEVSEAAVHESEAGAELPVYRGGDLRGLCENSVGKPDAGNRHVRFDERGRETGRIGTAPFLDSTLPQAQQTKIHLSAVTIYFRKKPILLQAQETKTHLSAMTGRAAPRIELNLMRCIAAL